MMNTALLIIDVQNSMFSADDPVYDSEKLIGNIKHLLIKARRKNIPVYYVQHNGPTGSGLENGTQGWKIHSEIYPFETHAVGDPAPELPTFCDDSFLIPLSSLVHQVPARTPALPVSELVSDRCWDMPVGTECNLDIRMAQTVADYQWIDLLVNQKASQGMAASHEPERVVLSPPRSCAGSISQRHYGSSGSLSWKRHFARRCRNAVTGCISFTLGKVHVTVHFTINQALIQEGIFISLSPAFLLAAIDKGCSQSPRITCLF